ncbi:sugar MFS transporter [Caulobacter sp. 17J80-11]|uniref:sugar MFS transporter n=1 Tax=Caulobacter sp. 17J80-11 TaxID=2763502 RepID=UPI001653B6F5|nr:sugar MFS transporter [Caulobacter sp. 17J80-11]MBC6983397.1 sugar MFS transporter [Caulobacter sp. 17J80-11]
MEYAGAPATGGQSGKGVAWLVPFVVMLFFAWGFATVLIDTLIPKLKGLFALSYAEVMLTQFCFFAAYFIMSVPSGFILSKLGYIRSVVVGLVVTAAGCLMFAPAARMGVYEGFLLALFIMASGITLLQVAANPLMALLGKPESSHPRLTFAQAFNSLGTFLGPKVGAALILAGGVVALPDASTMAPEALAALRVKEAAATQTPFLMIAAGLAVLALVFWFARRTTAVPKPGKAVGLGETLALLGNKRVALGALSIFIYVGAEVSIGSLMANYLMSADTVGFTAEKAGETVALYWGGAMIGRFVGGFLLWLTKKPGGLLTLFALGAAGLAATSAFSTGAAAAYAIVAVGLFNSIMFPTIFTLAIEGQAEKTPQASGLVCMAIVGGAIIPLATGALADRFGLHMALLLPAVCYLWIAIYGRVTSRPAAVSAVAEPMPAQ